jgi:lauroyl/myristoyl acyltransferase
MMGGAAALAVQTGAALLPAVLWFEGRGGWGVHIYPEVPVPAEGSRRDKIAAMTQQMARNFEAGIAAHPEDWHMLQRVFAADFDPGRLATAAGPGEELNAGVGGNSAGGRGDSPGAGKSAGGGGPS